MHTIPQILLLIHVVISCAIAKGGALRERRNVRTSGGSISLVGNGIAYNGSGLCVVALSRNLILTTTLDRAITQNPCYVPYFLKIWNTKISIMQVII